MNIVIDSKKKSKQFTKYNKKILKICKENLINSSVLTFDRTPNYYYTISASGRRIYSFVFKIYLIS